MWCRSAATLTGFVRKAWDVLGGWGGAARMLLVVGGSWELGTPTQQ